MSVSLDTSSVRELSLLSVVFLVTVEEGASYELLLRTFFSNEGRHPHVTS